MPRPKLRYLAVPDFRVAFVKSRQLLQFVELLLFLVHRRLEKLVETPLVRL